MRKTFYILIAAVLLGVVPVQSQSASTQVIYVDAVNGNDGNDGTIIAVRTMGVALEKAKAVHAGKRHVIVKFRPGVYRGVLYWRSQNDSAVTFEAETPGAAIISGADAWGSWRVDGRLLVHEWSYNWGLSPIPQGWISNGLNVNVPDIARRREMVIVDGKRVNQVLSAAGLSAANTFHIDESANTITLNLASTPKVIEVGVRQLALDVADSQNVTIRGLTFTGTAQHLDQSGAVINRATNVLLEDNRFVDNGAGGLGLSRSSGTSRRNVFNDNGATGWGGAYNRDLLSIDDTANRNNWRGASGGYEDWSVAGVKHLHQRRATYRNLTTTDNAAAGLWLDSDMEEVLVDGLVACRNTREGLYVEALQGPITVQNSRLCDNAQHGITISSVHHLTLTGNWITNNGAAGIFIGGSVPSRSIWDHETENTSFVLYPAKFMTWTGNFIGGRAEAAPALVYGTGRFNEDFQPTLLSRDNRWWNTNGSRPFREGNVSRRWYDLAGWQARTGQDKVGSVMGTPVATPMINPTPSLSPELQATSTERGTETAAPIVPTATARPPEATATPEGKVVWMIVGSVIVDVDLRVERVVE